MSKRVSNRKGHQVAALPIRLGENGETQVLLITSRETRRWIIPKGWPMKGLKDHHAARIEAREEAGLKGQVLSEPVGTYSYWRRTDRDFRRTAVQVYPMLVEREAERWKEKGQRDRVWLSVPDAADRVLEPELSSVIIAMSLDERLHDTLLQMAALHPGFRPSLF